MLIFSPNRRHQFSIEPRWPCCHGNFLDFFLEADRTTSLFYPAFFSLSKNCYRLFLWRHLILSFFSQHTHTVGIFSRFSTRSRVLWHGLFLFLTMFQARDLNIQDVDHSNGGFSKRPNVFTGSQSLSGFFVLCWSTVSIPWPDCGYVFLEATTFNPEPYFWKKREPFIFFP